MFDKGGTQPIVQRGGTSKKGGAGFKKGVRRRVNDTVYYWQNSRDSLSMFKIDL